MFITRNTLHLARNISSTQARQVRNISSTQARQVSAYNVAEQEQGDLRPATAQMKTLMDVGSRNIFDQDQDIFRESVRKFMNDEIRPKQEEFEKNGEPSREAWKSIGSQGLLGINIPAEIGGIGGSIVDEMIAIEEMNYSFCSSPAVSLHSTITMPYLAHYGTKEQQERYIPAMTAGDCIASLGITEPGAGSDMQGIRTTARGAGATWVSAGTTTPRSPWTRRTTRALITHSSCWTARSPRRAPKNTSPTGRG